MATRTHTQEALSNLLRDSGMEFHEVLGIVRGWAEQELEGLECDNEDLQAELDDDRFPPDCPDDLESEITDNEGQIEEIRQFLSATE